MTTTQTTSTEQHIRTGLVRTARTVILEHAMYMATGAGDINSHKATYSRALSDFGRFVLAYNTGKPAAQQIVTGKTPTEKAAAAAKFLSMTGRAHD